MSRSSDLRDAIVAHLKTVVSNPVDAVVIPKYHPSQLDPARVAVWINGRTIDSTQGPDQRLVEVGIAVAGLMPASEGVSMTFDQRKQQELAKADEYDALLEQLLALWTPNGPLVNEPFADHAFGVGSEVLQQEAIDATTYRQENIWLGMFSVTYFDSFDE